MLLLLFFKKTMFSNAFKILCSLPWIQGLVPEDGKPPLPPKSFSTPTRTKAFIGPCVLIGIVQLPSHVWLFVITYLASKQASQSFTILQFPQAHVLWVGDAISHSHPFIPSPSAHILSQHQVLFQWAGSSCQMACVGASSSASVLLLTIALLLPKQNSCFHSPNNIKHWYSLVEQGSSPLGNPSTAALPFSYHPLHLA